MGSFKEYWRPIHAQAVEEVREALGIETRDRLVIGIALWVMAITVVWYFGDRADARSEIVIHAAGFAILVLAFPIIYILKLFQIAPRLAKAASPSASLESDAAILEKWGTLDPLLLEQAACLWCEKSPLPSILKSDNSVSLQLEKLKRAILKEEFYLHSYP